LVTLDRILNRITGVTSGCWWLVVINDIPTTFCIITGLFISLKKHYENVSEKEPIFADEGPTVRAVLKNKNAEKYV
jgi:hypothetical protein